MSVAYEPVTLRHDARLSLGIPLTPYTFCIHKYPQLFTKVNSNLITNLAPGVHDAVDTPLAANTGSGSVGVDALAGAGEGTGDGVDICSAEVEERSLLEVLAGVLAGVLAEGVLAAGRTSPHHNQR